MEEAREEFLNLYWPREENLDGRALTRMARSAEGARAWSELFVRDTLPEGTTLEDPSSQTFTIVANKTLVPNSASVGVQIIGVGVHSTGVGVNNTSIARPNNARAQNPVVMAGPKEKLSKFDGNGMADPIRHCKTCEMIWRVNGITDTNEWVKQFPATLRGVTIDWFANTDPQKLNSWDNIKKEVIIEFQLFRDDNEIVAEIYNTK